MNETSNLDPAAMDRLQRLGGDEFVRKMIGLFVDYAAEKITAARQAMAEDNLPAVADAAHPIKSSAGNVGARKVQEIAQRIEQSARQSQREALPGLIAELEAAFAAAKTDLEQIKQSRASEPTGPGPAVTQ